MQFSADAIYSSRRSPVFARNIVSTSQPLATQAGVAMLRKGGNALDAALAAAMALVVVEPTSNGLGSDAFCIVWDGDELHGFNASGRSPAGWSPERFAGLERMPKRGWNSVTVPGAVSGWAELSGRFGRLPFEALFEPAIGYARRGFHVSPVIAAQWARSAETLRSEPGFADAFMPNGRAPHAGELFASLPLARSLELIAETNGRALYTGELAEKISAYAKKSNAALSLDDLVAHWNEWCGTLAKDFTDAVLHEIPPNGQGIAACMALGILEYLGIREHDVDTVAALHLQIEAMKLALADVHAYVADRRFMKEITVDHLLDNSYLAVRARQIDHKRASHYGPGRPSGSDTVCLAAGDENGMMVAYIQSNFSGFGSGVVVPGTGIALQNRGFGFSLQDGHPNQVGPAKRPFHTIIPGFVTANKHPLMAFGVVGGQMQAQGHVQMVLRTQMWDQDPQTAVEAPRWRVLGGLKVAIEPAVGTQVLSELMERGHHIQQDADDPDSEFGGAQVVHRWEAGYVAGSDPRKDGQAAGF